MTYNYSLHFLCCSQACNGEFYMSQSRRYMYKTDFLLFKTHQNIYLSLKTFFHNILHNMSTTTSVYSFRSQLY